MPRTTNRQRVEAFAREHSFDWHRLRAEFPAVSENTLRDYLHDLGIRLPQPYRGVWTKNFDELEESLVDMAASYKQIPWPSRTAVIRAKDRTRYISLNPKVDAAKRAEKAEMVQWMLVWLDDPAMFQAWASLRRKAR